MIRKNMKTACMVSALLLGLSACEPAKQDAAPETSITLTDGIYTVNATIPTFSDFIIVETQAGGVAPRVVSLDYALDDLAQYDVVFMGEAHGHVASHLAQTKTFQGLYARSESKKLALSMEQFERSQQDIVDQFLAGEIGEQMLMDEGKAWPHYRSSYRPTVEFAKRYALPVIAAEVPGNMVSCVGEEGPTFLDRLEGEARTWIADELHVQEGPYKEKYLRFLEGAAGHRVEDPNLTEEDKQRKRDYSFAAQVSRDDTMAMSMFDHLKANPGTQIMHTNGSFHSAGLLGTVERLKMRMPELKLANMHSILVTDPDNPQFDADLVGEGQYLLLIQPIPKNFVKMSNIGAFIKRTKGKIDENRCGY